MTDRDELAARLDDAEERLGATATLDHDPLPADEKRELAELFDPDAPGDPDLNTLHETFDGVVFDSHEKSGLVGRRS